MNTTEFFDKNPYSLARGVFRPRRTDDLKPEAIALIGKEFVWEKMFTIDGTEDYEGEYALYITPKNMPYWAPSGDVVFISAVEDSTGYTRYDQ